jgi:hypothetical protein
VLDFIGKFALSALGVSLSAEGFAALIFLPAGIVPDCSSRPAYWTPMRIPVAGCYRNRTSRLALHVCPAALRSFLPLPQQGRGA